MMYKDRYAPVAETHIVQDALPSGSLVGLALPLRGDKPCAVALMAGTDLVSIAAAAEFSLHAARLGGRLGWCGFTIGGFGQAAAMADHVELRCLASDKVLAWWDSAALAADLNVRQTTPIRLEQLLGRLQKSCASSDMEQIMSFGLDLAQRKGTLPFLKASWKYFLDREIDPQEIEEWGAHDYTEENKIRDVWCAVVASPECKMGKYYSRPGPFDPSFPFSRDALV